MLHNIEAFLADRGIWALINYDIVTHGMKHKNLASEFSFKYVVPQNKSFTNEQPASNAYFFGIITTTNCVYIFSQTGYNFTLFYTL